MTHRVVGAFGPRAMCGALGLLACAAALAEAQQGSLRGTVSDPAGQPLAEAVVMADSLGRVARTDGRGRFFLNELPRGELALTIRRLGFEPRVVHVFVTTMKVDEVRITMRPQAVVLEGVSTREARRRQGILEFHQRRERGVGTFFTRQEILDRNAKLPSDMLRTVPGVRFVGARSGRGIRFVSTSIARRDCMPMIWLDGARAPGLELDDVPVYDIEGIELYTGPSTTPMQFSPGPVTTCGTIVIWTRQPGR